MRGAWVGAIAVFVAFTAGCASETGDEEVASTSDGLLTGVQPGTLLYSETFDDGAANGFVKRKGTYQIQAARYMGGGTPYAASTLPGVSLPAGYDLELDGQYGGAGETIDWLKSIVVTDAFAIIDYKGGSDFKWAGVIRKGSTNVYSCVIGRYDGAMRTSAKIDACITREATSPKWYHLKVAVRGATVTLSVDGVDRKTFTFSAPLAAQAGVGANPYGWGKVDNVVITAR